MKRAKRKPPSKGEFRVWSPGEFRVWSPEAVAGPEIDPARPTLRVISHPNAPASDALHSGILQVLCGGYWLVEKPNGSKQRYQVRLPDERLHVEPVRTCRICGCCEYDPCVTDSGTCSWADKDLCTACLP